MKKVQGLITILAVFAMAATVVAILDENTGVASGDSTLSITYVAYNEGSLYITVDGVPDGAIISYSIVSESISGSYSAKPGLVTKVLLPKILADGTYELAVYNSTYGGDVSTFMVGSIMLSVSANMDAYAGTIDNPNQSVPYDGEVTFTASMTPGFRISNATSTSGNVTFTDSTVTVTGITDDATVIISAAIKEYDVTATLTSGAGSFVGGSSKKAVHGESVEFTVLLNGGYSITNVNGTNCVSAKVSGSNKVVVTGVFDNSKITVTATYKNPEPPLVKYTISASAGVGGTISPNGNVSVNSGSSQTFTITANDGYSIDNVLVDGKVAELQDGMYTFVSVTKNCTISASFVEDKEKILVKVDCTAGGSVSPSGEISINSGDSREFTITVNNGFELDEVIANGESVQVTNGKFLLEDITGFTEVKVSFKEIVNDDGNDDMMVWIAIAIVAIIIIMVVAIVVIKR